MLRLTDFKLNKKAAKKLSTKDDFFLAISNLNNIKLNRKIVVLYVDDEIQIYQVNPSQSTSSNPTIDLLFIYKPESTYLFDKIVKIFNLNNEAECSMFSMNVFNNFTLLMPTPIWDCLLTRYVIESNGEKLYTTFNIPKKNGKVREITAPHEDIKKALQRLNPLLQAVYDHKTADFQVAYKKGKNVKSGAALHVNKKYVFNIDLKDFYPSCKRELVKKYIDFLFAYSANMEYLENEFLDTILRDDGLFIGSPVSGTLANAIVSGPATFLKNICAKYDMTFSIYADDMTFGSNKRISKKFINNLFKSAFSSYKLTDYFNMNDSKSVGFTGCNRKVTGVVINNDNMISVKRSYFRNIRVAIDHLAKGDVGINPNKLRGKIAYATMVDDSGKIYRYLNKYLDTVKQYNLCSDEKLKELETKFSGK